MRIEKKFLFGLKRLLLSCGWEGFETRVDIDSKSILIDGHRIVTISTTSNKCEFVYADGWGNRLNDPTYHELVKSCETQLPTKKRLVKDSQGKEAGKQVRDSAGRIHVLFHLPPSRTYHLKIARCVLLLILIMFHLQTSHCVALLILAMFHFSLSIHASLIILISFLPTNQFQIVFLQSFKLEIKH